MNTLNDYLNVLKTSKQKKKFLHSIYEPGKEDVANALLSLDPDNRSILIKEMMYFKEKDKDKFISYGIKFIDNFIGKFHLDYGTSLDIIKEDNELIEYFLSKVNDPHNVIRKRNAADFAKRLGRDDIRKKVLEEIIEDGSEKDSHQKAKAAEELERFNESIDFYINAAESFTEVIPKALQIAKEHVPEKVNGVAEKGFEGFSDIHNNFSLYAECAIILDEKERATKVVKKKLKKINKKYELGLHYYFKNIVDSMVILNMEDEAREFISELEQNFEATNPEDFRELYMKIGDSETANTYFRRKIDQLDPEENPENVIEAIDEYYELTEDESVLDKKFSAHLEIGDYKGASEVKQIQGYPSDAELLKEMGNMKI
ncbi:MAG: hypothetical protein ACQER9_03905 [Nanobdellota archaeon]